MAGPTWRCITHDPAVQRSSHTVSVLDGHVFLFGGEIIPRQPRDNKIFAIDLGSESSTSEVSIAGDVPAPRVGSASTTLSSKMYIFSGRGGPSMAPIEESGGLWCFDPQQSIWSLIMPSDSSAQYPAARSYHCMTSDGVDRIFVHAGCPVSGRLGDLWSFSIIKRAWTQLPNFSEPPRGGASIAFSNGKLYRMNGFDGKHEQGGAIDICDCEGGTMVSRKFKADGKDGPEARSVSALVPVQIDGRAVLVTLFGERDPSNLGHAGAGKMLEDIWVYDIESGTWREVTTGSGDAPPARGWFDADVLEDNKIVVAGGLNEKNERLDDVWILPF